jgi:Ca2+-binding RTX toxin-like protein
MDTQNSPLPIINRREFMPIMRYGRFAGPGYSGGWGPENYFTKPDDTTVLIKDLVKTPEGLGQLMQAQASVEPVDFIDAVTKEHDIAYTVVEMRFMTRVSEAFQGRYEYQLTAEEKNSAEFRVLVEARNREFWEADKPMLESLARYEATNPLTQQYRLSALDAFGAKGRHEYGFKEETEEFYLSRLKPIDSSIELPSIRGALSTFLTASRDAKTDFEALATLPFSEQEKGFFIQHLENFSYLETATHGADGNLIPQDQLDYRYRIPVPTNSDDVWSTRVRMGESIVEMVLDKSNPDSPVFTKSTIVNGEVVRLQIIRPEYEGEVGDYGERTWFVQEFEGDGNLVSSHAITPVESPSITGTPYASEDAAAVLNNDYEGVLNRPSPEAGEPKPAPVVRDGDAAHYLDEETGRHMLNTSWGGVAGWESVLEQMFGRPDITISFSPDGVGVLLNENNEPIGFVYRLPGRENPVLENMDGEIISVSQDGKMVRLDPNTYEETPIDIPGYLQSSKTSGLSNLIRYQDQQVTAILGDINSLVSAIKSGEPLPILSSGLNLLNDFVNPLAQDGVHLRNIANHELNAAATVVGGLNSLYSLQNAFKHGDTLDKITATASTVNFVNSTLYKSINNVPGGAFSTGLDSVLNGTGGLAAGGMPGVLPVLGLINGIRSGDPIGITQGLIGVINPGMLAGPVGWALMAVQILRAIFDEPPEAWGTAKVVFDDAYGTQLDVVGEAFGKDRVTDKQNAVLDYFRLLIEQSGAASPNDPLGVIPQRMPILTWRERRQRDPGYSILDIDPLTGAQRYPYLRYDDNGVPFSADPNVFQVDPTDPGQRLPFMQALVMSALERGALSPMWEVKTAKMQQDSGDPNAGLTEEERAAKAGLSGQVNAETNERDPGQFRPIILDMNGNGQIETVGKDASGVTFDWDASGFQKKVAWTDSGEGFLFLDRNPNGAVDSGKELFSNSMVADAAKGVRSMAWVDGNGDGKIDELDPVFGELRVWRDDGDGVLEDGEAKRLSALGISAIDYQMGRFTRDGQYYAMGSPELEAEEEGSKVNVTEAGIRVEFSNGELSLYITRVLTDVGANINSDTFDMYEDADPVARTAPGTAIIAAALLLANDEFDGVSAGLTITGVGNASNGTVTLGTDPTVGQAVFFKPHANYNGPASFEYTVAAPDGTEHVANVSVNILAVNDLPVATDQKDADRPIYGYRTVSYTVSQGENDYTYTHTTDPIYAPYTEAVQVPVYGYVGEDGYTIVGYETEYVQRNTVIGSDSPPSGHVRVADPDGPAQVRFEIASAPVYGKVEINANTGGYSYVGLRPAGIRTANGSYINPENGQAVRGNTYSNLYAQGEETFIDIFTVKVIDLEDPTGQSFVYRDIPVTHYGPRPLPEVQDGGKKPIAIDLNGDGFHFVGVDDSNVFFDVNGDGWRRKIAWNNPEDGFIAYDKNGDGKIDSYDELSFVPYKPDSQTDLEGLQAFDTNEDGMFSAADAEWRKFGVWQDANSDGITDPGEFKRLDEIGIQSVSLSSDGQFQVVDGQTVHGVGAATKTDGSQLAIADVTLQYKNLTQVRQADGTLAETEVPRFTQGEIFQGTAEADLVFGTKGSDRFVMEDGDDTVMDDGGNDVVEAGAGNDLIYTGNDNDFVDGGVGDDTVFAGNGNDALFGGDGNDLLMAEGGNDVAFGGAGNDFLSGGVGNDALSGGAGDDVVAGEEGWDAVFGEEGNDELYGHAGNDVLYGGDGNDILDGGEGDDTMEGDGGDDTYIVGSAADQVIEAGNAGTDTVLSSIDYTLGAHLENLTLTDAANLNGTGNAADNVLVGNSGANMLTGGEGNDVLDGGRGADTLIGSAGDDTYVVDNVGDAVAENAGEGVDTVRSRISYTLGEHVENLTLTGIDATDGTGNAQSNVIVGNAASNRIDGEAGADEMRGGRGNDTYVVGQAGDNVVEAAGEGIDSVEAGIDYTLGGNVENLRLTGAAIRGTGNELDNVLVGNGGDNVLDGGVGADLMAGGAGSDTYHVDDANDVVIESADAGNDTVVSSVSYSLSANVENLTLAGDAISGSGNGLGNVLTGNAYDNLLDGGAGADAMAGGAGDDTYVVDNAGDAIFEEIGEGTDHVLASVGYTLAADVENLTLTGTAALLGGGNELDNVLTANDGGNTLSGFDGSDILIGGMGNDVLDGGVGADLMQAGAGDDTYIVDHAGDQVIEGGGEGIDTVFASVGHALTANVEKLQLTGTAVDGTGNELDNFIAGNAGNNVLDGGAGADEMAGGAGDDTYIVDNAGDAVAEQAGEGMDTVKASVSQVLSADVENLVLAGSADLTATGNGLDNRLAGNSGNNALFGMAGNDLLVGEDGHDFLDGGAGTDGMQGGGGDDAYIVDDQGDIVIEHAGEGVDAVLSSVDYLLSANVENMTLTGGADLTATGNELDNVLVANGGNSTLFGMAGNDVLIGGIGDDQLDGGEGGDQMQGGDGSDTYVVDDANDAVAEFFNGGMDSVLSGIDYVLPEHVEHLMLTGSALRATGNELDNVLRGNALDNILDGREGADEMRGAAGDDTYIVDDAGDLVVEAADAGIDAVLSSVDYMLTANVENLQLTGNAISGTGNELDNALLGNSEGNVLDGGVGADTMAGGAGNDVYVVDNVGDLVVEETTGGVDIVLSSVSYALSNNAEHLSLTGDADLTATGNELDNVLVANSGNSTLIGLAGSDVLIGASGDDHLVGGTGRDVLIGGGGNDTYYYSEGDGLDLIIDMEGADTLRFGPGLTLDNLALRVIEVNGQLTAQVRVLDDSGNEQPDQGVDFVVTAVAGGGFATPIERFVLDDGQQLLFDDLLIKQTIIRGTNKADLLNGDRNDNTIFGSNQNDVLRGGTGHDILYGENGNDALYGGGGNDGLYGGNGNDLLTGEGGDDFLDGGNGNDIVQAGNGRDVVYVGNGNDLVEAGSGGDVIYGENGDDWIAGGQGDDLIDAGEGANVIAFARGDGNDTVVNSFHGNDIISLGGIHYADMKLVKAGNDLTLAFGAGDSITLSDWYAGQQNRGIDKLQVVTNGTDYDSSSKDKTRNKQVGIFDFSKIVQHFDAARAANTVHEAGWDVMNSLLDSHLTGSQTQAIGGDLSFQYATNGSLSGIGLDAAQSSLNNVSGMRTLKSREQLEQASVRLV